MTEREFPILRTTRERRDFPGGRRSVPWSWVAPHEDQARSNHGQSLERLAQRGGLGPDELLCTVHGRSLRAIFSKALTLADAEAWLATWDGSVAVENDRTATASE